MLTIKLLKSTLTGSYKVLRPSIVAKALLRLRSTAIHPNFAGYLAVKRAARQANTDSNLQCNFREFFDSFLKVGASTQKPYLMPFNEAAQTPLQNVWFNKNVSGSYAPSSLRTQSAFTKVVDVVGSGKTVKYSLKKEHPRLAFSFLLSSKLISASDLAIVLYRDYGFTNEDMQPQFLVEIFREDFGFRENIESEKQQYESLFSDENKFDSKEAIFESFE